MMKIWRQYEEYICEHLKRLYPDQEILFDQKIDGILSKTKRQIDILINGKVSGISILVVIDCKCYKKRIDVKDVESFISMLADVKASTGVMITNIGYSAAALERAKNDGRDIKVEVLILEELESFNGNGSAIGGAINHDIDFEFGIHFPCPTDWEIHNTEAGQEPPIILTRPNVPLNQAFKNKNSEIIQIGFLLQYHPFQNIEEFQQGFVNEAIRFNPKITSSSNSFTPLDSGFGNKIFPIIHSFNIPNSLHYEYAIFVDYGSFFGYFTLQCRQEKSDIELKKLEFIARRSIPFCQPSGYPILPGFTPVTPKLFQNPLTD